MTAKELLKKYGVSKRKIEVLKARRDELFSMAIDTPGAEIAVIDGERCIVPKSHGSGRSDRIERIVIDMVEIDEAIDREVEEAIFDMNVAVSYIDKIPIMEWRKVLQLRYINCMKWEDIADAIFSTKQTAYNYHNNGISIIEKMLEEEDAHI